MKNICPICGYPELSKPAYHPTSFEICPSCGFQFGFTDHSEHITHEQWRVQWIEKGMTWRSKGIKPPLDWNPREQLRNVGVKV